MTEGLNGADRANTDISIVTVNYFYHYGVMATMFTDINQT